MSYDSRIEDALSILNDHNSVIGSGNPGFVETDKFLSDIKAAGGTSESALAMFSWEDLSKLGVPMVLARQIGKSWRAGAQGEDSPKPISPKKVQSMTPRQLVEAFDPEEPTNPVARRLSAISNNEPFIVFSSGRVVDVDTTHSLLMEIKQSGMKGRDVFNGKRVYSIGELPDDFTDENPLFPGRALRPIDESCDVTDMSWKGITLETRQFVRYLRDEGRLDTKRPAACDLIEMLSEPDGVDRLRRRYKVEAVAFDELKANNPGNLPSLKVPVSRSKSSSSGCWENPTKV